MGYVAPVLVVTGTRREAAVLKGRAGIKTLAIGGRADLLDDLATPFRAVVSFGMAGGLRRNLHIGDWVVGEGVCGKFWGECDPEWSAKLASSIPNAETGLIFADGHLIDDVGEKYDTYINYRTLAVDMESHIAGELARRAGVPFAIVRCISDEVDHSLPAVVAVAMKPDGSLALTEIVKAITRNPAQVPEIISTFRNFIAAYRAFKRGVRTLDLTLPG